MYVLDTYKWTCLTIFRYLHFYFLGQHFKKIDDVVMSPTFTSYFMNEFEKLDVKNLVTIDTFVLLDIITTKQYNIKFAV